ncbi:DMT family transporter [Photobacterium swingsii]|uniref:EamA/RhaT family transporter n=1 Tax=Photobacterium swingsii TaxID=680026 RepID=A0A0J8VBF5_9GAMM|nr:DMT family transporter [Photobacterium swingsii]KMV30641.1 membrane protein [Photobacterium swingsii]PSW26635.1 EamA/RhaT family transporter [Photobacterium swingsii]
MSKIAPNKSLGLTLALICAALWGASFPLGGVLAGKLDPVVLAIARYAIATLGFVVLFVFSKKHTLKKIQSKKDAILLMSAGISAQAVFFYFTILAYEYTSSGEIGVINGMAPFLTMAAVFIIDKVKPSAVKVFAVVLSLVGAGVIAYDPSNKIQGLNFGHLFALCGVLGFVTYNYILGKFGSDLNSRYDTFSSCFYQFGAATVVLLVVGVVTGADFSTATVLVENGKHIATILSLGLLCSGIAYAVWEVATLKTQDAVITTMALNVLPLFAMIVAYFLLGETITLQKLAGVVTVVIALCIYTAGDKFKKKASLQEAAI